MDDQDNNNNSTDLDNNTMYLKKMRKVKRKNTNSFGLDFLKGIGLGLLFSIALFIVVIFIWDLMRGSIPLQSLISTIEWMIRN